METTSSTSACAAHPMAAVETTARTQGFAARMRPWTEATRSRMWEDVLERNMGDEPTQDPRQMQETPSGVPGEPPPPPA